MAGKTGLAGRKLPRESQISPPSRVDSGPGGPLGCPLAMGFHRAGPFYLGLGLTTAATLALEVLQTRILSVVAWYHLAFFVISVALFGLTVGALLVFLRPGLTAGEDTGAALAR